MVKIKEVKKGVYQPEQKKKKKNSGGAKGNLLDMVGKMTEEECFKIMPKLMKLMGGKTPQMKKMMATKNE